MQKKYDIEFQPIKQQRRDQVTRFALGFGAILLLLVVASVFVWQREGLLDNLFNNDATVVPYEDDNDDVWAHQGEGVFLISAHDNPRQTLHFVMLLEVDITHRRMQITPLSPQAATTYRNRDITLEEAFRQGGIRELKNAVAMLTGRSIDRYIAADERAFVRYIDAMGRAMSQAVVIHLDEGIDFAGDFRLRLVQGDNPLQGDMLLRYFRYLGRSDETLKQQGELFAQMLETYLVPRNAGSTAVLETRFHSLSDILDTDITVADFFANRDMLMDLLAESDQIAMEVRTLS